ncbi:hypothetical protein H5410_048353 [Solanum commersonii]|uniref:S-protein homolog n=1 Tax=Solanum commersonii TaxID=4109 RepID=A0A9J5XK55_SOLCO|nr:hypothetical protein H5410_048353 [Solanum commersonii]
MPSSSHHHFVLCLFLIKHCYVNDDIDPGEEILLNPGMSDHITTTFLPRKSNTLSCILHLGQKYADLVTLFDSNDRSICHNPSEECLWKIQEDGLCMFSQGKCVMFNWDNNLSIRHIASEPKKYIRSDELKSEHIIWKKKLHSE